MEADISRLRIVAISFLISCGARLAPFDIKELRDLMEYDDLELDTLGEQKTALFVIISDTDATNLILAHQRLPGLLIIQTVGL